MPQIKIAIATTFFLLFFALFSFVWLGSINMQFFGFALAFYLAWIMLGTRPLVSQLRLLLPFIVVLALVYALLILLGISPEGTSARDYWYEYGATRTMLLISTILMFRVCFSLIHFHNLLQMRPSIHLLKYIILGRILYKSAHQTHAKLCFWQEMIPTEEYSQPKLKHRFRLKLASALAMTLYILTEAEQKGMQIDNRILCCHKEPK